MEGEREGGKKREGERDGRRERGGEEEGRREGGKERGIEGEREGGKKREEEREGRREGWKERGRESISHNNTKLCTQLVQLHGQPWWWRICVKKVALFSADPHISAGTRWVRTLLRNLCT